MRKVILLSVTIIAFLAPASWVEIKSAAAGTNNGAFEVQLFDLCLQDDSNSSTVLLINTQTGDYRFCCGGQSFTGRGRITRKGNTISLDDNPGTVRLVAKADMGTRRAAATLRAFPTGICTIMDRDIGNNTCKCALP